MFTNQPSTTSSKRGGRYRSWALLTALLITASFTFVACNDDDDDDNAAPTPQTIAELVTSNDQFSLLEAAVTRAGLAATLSGAGPFTVFAPTDDAFRAAGFDAARIGRTGVDTLRNILLYHVVGSSVPASAIQTGQASQPTALTANGTIYVSRATSGTVSVNGARVSQADVAASNGIIHVIDRVLLPPAGNVLQVVQADTSLRLLTAAALRGGAQVIAALSGSTPLTVFAPTNAAFQAAGFRDTTAINAADPALLTAVLTNHVVANARAYSPTVANGPITTFGTGSVTATVGSNNATITLLSPGNGTNVANVLDGVDPRGLPNRDRNATNGVIHKIDRVLLP